MKTKETKMPIKNVVKLHSRALQDIHKISPGLFPAMAMDRIINAIKPYAAIYISARLLNELTSSRRVEAIRFWVLCAVFSTAFIALLNAFVEYHKNRQENIFFQKYETHLFAKKMFTMDFTEMDKQSTHDLRSQIRQNANWMGWGISRTLIIISNAIKDATGILGAIVLTYSLFTTPIPDSAGKLTLLNHPIFVPVLFGVMLGISALGGFFRGKASSCFANLGSEVRFANRLFTFYNKLGNFLHQAADIRLYNQQHIANHYFLNYILSPDSFFVRGFRGPIALYKGFAGCVSALLTGFIYIFTCVKAWAGAFGIGSVTQYVGAATAMSENLSSLIGLMEDCRTNAIHLQMTYDFLDIPNAMYQGSLTTEKRSDRQYEVEFRNVSFRYPGADTWALRHVNIKFRVGSRLAVVGENGSGKTTFIKLLCRLYDPQEGEILLNGIDIRKYNYRDYMNIFSVVFQDFQLVSQPLGTNVAGCMNYDREKVTKALIDAGFGARLTTLPEGLDTYLYKDFGQNGVEISGGEAQKIAIARALYKDAPFIILDEPTAALDPIAEAEIYAQFNQISGDKTAIYISHRLSSCRFCDEILVFDKGQIVQTGSHENLVALENGKYHELWHAQAQYYTE